MHCNGVDGIEAGVIEATVSISIEQSHELDYEAQDCLATNNGGVTTKTTTLSMSRRQTRKIITTAFSPADCPLDVDTVITFADQPNEGVTKKKSNGVGGTMKRNKRKKMNKKNNPEIQPPKKHFSNSDARNINYIDKNEMSYLCDSSPQQNQLLPSYPSSEILINCSLSDKKTNDKNKTLKKANNRKKGCKRGGNFTRPKKSKKKSNIKKGTNRAMSSESNEKDMGLATLPAVVTSLKPDENVPSNLKKNEMNSFEKLDNIETQHKLHQSVCCLNEREIESLLQLNVHCLKEALNLTLWQLNAIGINKATQFEAILSTVVNGQDVDLRKVFPRPMTTDIDELSCEKQHQEVQKEGDDENRLVIDESECITVNEEENMEINMKSTLLNNSISPIELPTNVDENDIRQATEQIAQRIEKIKTSNAECRVKKQELLYILDRLNELENREKLLKFSKSEKQQISMKSQLIEEMCSKTLNENRENNASTCELLPINAVTDEISALNAQDKNKDQSIELTEPDEVNKLTLVSGQPSNQTRAGSEEEEYPMSKMEESNNKSGDDINARDENEKSLKDSKLTSTPESSKMTLRSQRKIITTNMSMETPKKHNTSPKTYLPQPKVLISKIKPRRLKLPKRSVTTVQSNSQQVLNNSHSMDVMPDINVKSSVPEQLNTPEKEASLKFVETPQSSSINSSALNSTPPNSLATNVVAILNNSTANTYTTNSTDNRKECFEEAQSNADSTDLQMQSKEEILDIKFNKVSGCETEEEHVIKESETKSQLLQSSPSNLASSKLTINILNVDKLEVLQLEKTSKGESCEVSKIVLEKPLAETSNDKKEDKSIGPITTTIEKVEEKTSEQIKDNETIEESIVLKCAEKEKNSMERVLDQPNTNNIEDENIREDKCSLDDIAFEPNCPEIDVGPKKNCDAISDEENWDNDEEESCLDDRRKNKNKFHLERKNYNGNNSQEKRHKNNDYYQSSNRNSYGYNNNNPKSRKNRNNAYQRGFHSKYGWEGQANNAESYSQQQNNDQYTEKQFSGNDSYNKRKTGFADDLNGRLSNNIKTYTVEERCSESRGPYQVKYDSDEDWDKADRVETYTEKNNSSYCKTYKSSNNGYNNKNNNKRNDPLDNNYEEYRSINSSNTSNTCYNATGDSFGNQTNVFKNTTKNVCTENLQSNQNMNLQLNSANYKQAGKNKVHSDGWDIASPTALSPTYPEIKSPSYSSVNNLSEPVLEIDAHMSFPPMPYRLREIKLPNIEVNKPDSLDKLLRSNTVDPRLLKYKDKGYTTSGSSMLSYYASQQISQYDPRRRTSVMHTSTAQSFQMDCCSPMQPQNSNVLLYGYLQRSSWYQGLMSSVKMQINHSIAELVRALNNFQKKRIVDASAVFDVFKIDCAVELLEIMRNIGIFIDANGCISETKGFGEYGQRTTLNRSEINATYSFMPQLLPSHIKPSESQSTQLPYPVALPPQMRSASFVSCYVDAPTLTPTVPRRSCGYNVQTVNSTLSPSTIDVMHEMNGSGSDAAYYSNNHKRYNDMGHDIRNDAPHALGASDGEIGNLNIAYLGNQHRGVSFNYRPSY